MSESLDKFTGLYDVNKVKIFENDIVRAYDNLGSLKGKVVWSEKHKAWMIDGTEISLNEFAEYERQVIYRKDAVK